MRITFCTLASLIAIFSVCFIYGCSNNSVSTEQKKTATVDSISVTVSNDSLTAAINVVDTTTNYAKSFQTAFTKDSVDLYTSFPTLSSGNCFLVLMKTGVQPGKYDTVYTKLITSASSPSTIRVPNSVNVSSFALNLSSFTGSAYIRITNKK